VRRLALFALLIGFGALAACEDDSAYTIGPSTFQNDVVDGSAGIGGASDAAADAAVGGSSGTAGTSGPGGKAGTAGTSGAAGTSGKSGTAGTDGGA
jgi:hypothetical protein